MKQQIDTAEFNEEGTEIVVKTEAIAEDTDVEIFEDKGEEGENSEERFTTENPVWNLEIEEKSNIREEAKEYIKVNSEYMLDESVK